MKLSHQTIELNPMHPFVIARGGYAHHRNVIVRITGDDGVEGFGEAAPNRYYGESVSTVLAALGQFKPILERADPFSLESIESQLNRVLRGNASAKSAVSAALHDLIGKRLGLPVYRIWGLDATTTPQSSFTIAIAENDELERRVTEAREPQWSDDGKLLFFGIKEWETKPDKPKSADAKTGDGAGPDSRTVVRPLCRTDFITGSLG